MDIYFMCPKCEQRLVVDAVGAGLHINCPNCTQRLIVPDPPVMRSVDVEFLPPEEADDVVIGETLPPTPPPPPRPAATRAARQDRFHPAAWRG